MPEGDEPTRLVVFSLDGRDYALPVEHVSEIIRMVTVSPLPEAPEWMVGLINLRGNATPVVDLGARLGFGFRTIGLNTPIMIASRPHDVGLIVDAVTDVISIDASSIRAPDASAGSIHAVSAVARTRGRLVMVLDLERCMSGQLDAEGARRGLAPAGPTAELES